MCFSIRGHALISFLFSILFCFRISKGLSVGVFDECVLHTQFTYILYAFCLSSCMIFYNLVLLRVFCALINRETSLRAKGEYLRIRAGKEEKSNP